MKKLIGIIMLVVFIAGILPGTALAGTPVKKLGRGLANVVTSPIEFFSGISHANNENGFMAALTWGVIRGLAKTVQRAVVGVYEVATFPIPIPRDYEPIMEDPEFFGE